MKKKKEVEIKKSRALMNNIYAIKLMWSLSKSRVLHTAITVALGYLAWIFYSAFFIRYIVHSLETQKSFFTILRFILIVAAVQIVASVYLAIYNGRIEQLTRVSIYKKLYHMLYKKARNVELRCYEDAKFYNKYTLAVEGADEKLISVIQNLFGILFGAIAAAVAFSTMYEIDRIAFLFVLSPIIGNFVFGFLINKLYYKRDQAMVPYRRRIEYINRVMHLSDYSKEMRLSKVYYLLKRKFDKAIDGIFSVAEDYSIKIIVPLWFRNYFTFTLIFEGVLLYGAYRTIVSQTIRFADLTILTSIMVASTWILIGFSDSILQSMKNGLFIENLRVFLDYKEEIPEDYDGIMPEADIKSIEFRNVSFGYQPDSLTIKNLSFIIPGATSLALVGHNGAGKSTIIKLLFRMYDPTEGEILLNGRNIKEYNLKVYRELFAAAFQDYKIFALSVKENVLMRKATPEDDEIVQIALRKAGVYDKIMKLQNGMDTILTKEFDEEGAILSGGEFQKIVVARAFAKQSSIKVFDEPSSALDPIAEYELYESILKDSLGKTMIFISHRLSSVRNADLVLMLEQGELIEQGTHSQLMEQNGVYADMYLKQAKNYLAIEALEEVAVTC